MGSNSVVKMNSNPIKIHFTDDSFFLKSRILEPNFPLWNPTRMVNEKVNEFKPKVEIIGFAFIKVFHNFIL